MGFEYYSNLKNIVNEVNDEFSNKQYKSTEDLINAINQITDKVQQGQSRDVSFPLYLNVLWATLDDYETQSTFLGLLETMTYHELADVTFYTTDERMFEDELKYGRGNKVAIIVKVDGYYKPDVTYSIHLATNPDTDDLRAMDKLIWNQTDDEEETLA